MNTTIRIKYDILSSIHMENCNISVIIPTRNRPYLLKKCLESLVNQSLKPFEVIVVDNGPDPETKEVCAAYLAKIPLSYRVEKRKGPSFCRNKGISLATGTVVALIDDDCITDAKWLEMIKKHFKTYRSDGVIGFTVPQNPINIPSCVEDTYYYRWMLQYIPAIDRPCLLKSGAVIDSRNAAFLSGFIKKFKFNNSPYASNEDVEMGIRLFQASQNICYNPSIRVFHRNSESYKDLFRRNIITGYTTQELVSSYGIRINQIRSSYNRKEWKNYYGNVMKSLRHVQDKLLFAVIFQIYPWFSRIGRLTYFVAHLNRKFY
jgi:glycosyltransferase involved in cell wall biosynthesis